MTESQRQPHCVLGSPTRLEKARKIEVVLSRRRALKGARWLEIGSGAGIMAAAFAQMVGPNGEVIAVDIFDQREVFKGYRFVKVEDATLPFPNDSFDIVVSNHVMEHVGTVADQLRHLREINRVLAHGGVAYIAVPNRWRVIEPHFHLPFLSWLPPRVANLYVRLSGKGEWYDVVPPSSRRMERLLTETGFRWKDCTVEAAQVMAEVEPSVSRLTRRLLTAPEWVLRAGFGLVPSLIYVAVGTEGSPAKSTRTRRS